MTIATEITNVQYKNTAQAYTHKSLAKADAKWSLSALTFPHPIVRIILAEQLYRAQSILKNHPYHRY